MSAREAEVLAALAEHLTNAEISARLFISVRTVESHVSSLLRKFQVGDRRALVAVASTVRPASASAKGSGAPSAVAARLPSALTPFVGRVVERAALAEALVAHRLVTAVGPGGVGKTRLALSVAADVIDEFADGAWFVDLVPVTDPAMIAPAIGARSVWASIRAARRRTPSSGGWRSGRHCWCWTTASTCWTAWWPEMAVALALRTGGGPTEAAGHDARSAVPVGPPADRRWRKHRLGHVNN